MTNPNMRKSATELSLAELDHVQGGFWPLFLGAVAIGVGLGVSCGERNNEADEEEREQR